MTPQPSAPSGNELDRRNLSPWCYCMVAGSHRLRSKLRNPHSGGWEGIVVPLVSVVLISHSVLSLLGACPVVISYCTFLATLSPKVIGSIDSGDNVEILTYVVQSLATSYFSLYARTAAVAFLQQRKSVRCLIPQTGLTF